MTRAGVLEGAEVSRVADTAPTTSDTPTRSPTREYKCEHCDKIFKSMIRLRNHRRTHPVRFADVQDSLAFMVNDLTSGRDPVTSPVNDIRDTITSREDDRLHPDVDSSSPQNDCNATFTINQDLSSNVALVVSTVSTKHKARRRSAIPLSSSRPSFQRNTVARNSLREESLNRTFTVKERTNIVASPISHKFKMDVKDQNKKQTRVSVVNQTNISAQRRHSILPKTPTRNQRRLSSLSQTPTRNQRRLSSIPQISHNNQRRLSSVYHTPKSRTGNCAPNGKSLFNNNTNHRGNSDTPTGTRVSSSTVTSKVWTPNVKTSTSSCVRTPRKDVATPSRKTTSIKSRTPLSSKLTPKRDRNTPKSNKSTPKSNNATPKSNKGTPKSNKGTPSSSNKNTPGGMKHKCHRCGKGFMTRRLLDVHYVVHIRDSPKSCGISHDAIKNRPKRLQLLQQTTPWSPSLETQIFKCDTCGRVYQRERYLLAHKKTHTINTPYACDVCRKSFKYLSSLKSHKIIHVGEKSHNEALESIERGEKVDNRRSSDAYTTEVNSLNLVGSVKNMFSSKKDTLSKCSILEESEDCQFACKSCTFKTTEPIALLKHMRSHSARRPYVCTKCNKSYATKANLDVHEKIHVIDRLRLVLKTRSKTSL